MRKLIFTIILIINACAVGPDYKKPEISTPGFWHSFKNLFGSNQKNEELVIEQNWWDGFNDPILESLVVDALNNNLDLQIEESKIAETRANITKKSSALYPKIDANAPVSRSNKYFNPLAQTRRKPINIFQAGFDASWELDFFGGARRAKEAAEALFESSIEARNAALISLIAEVARNYVDLRNMQNQIELNQKSIAALEEILKLEIGKNEAGLVSDIDVHKINIEILERKSAILDLETALNTSALRIEVLLSKNPGELREKLSAKNGCGKKDKNCELIYKFPHFNQNIIVKAPASVLRNRPDIRKAERDLQVATALEGVAIAGMYPKISLTGFLGFQSLHSNTLLSAPSKAFSLGSTVSLPIFNFGRIKADIKVSKAKKDQALLAYKSTVLKALEDVENSLTAYANQTSKMVYASNSLASSGRIFALNQDLNDSGVISRVEFLRSKIDFYQSHITLIETESALNKNIIALYKALGGGWEVKNIKK